MLENYHSRQVSSQKGRVRVFNTSPFDSADNLYISRIFTGTITVILEGMIGVDSWYTLLTTNNKNWRVSVRNR